MEARAEIEPGSLRKLIQASRTWDAVSRREMRKGLRAAASQPAASARAEVLGPPPAQSGTALRRSRSTGLRAGLAGGVKVSIRTGREAGGTVKGEGVRVSTTSSKLDGDKAPMVKAYMAREFRHPVFGRDTYVSQRGKNWFYRPLLRGRDEYQRAVVEAIQAASRAITD